MRGGEQDALVRCRIRLILLDCGITSSFAQDRTEPRGGLIDIDNELKPSVALRAALAFSFS
jgi:hypothetical protein